MKCGVCGSQLEALATDLPFKVSEKTIVIVKNLPVLQCENCTEYVIEDPVLSRVDTILAGAGAATELEIIRYAA